MKMYSPESLAKIKRTSISSIELVKLKAIALQNMIGGQGLRIVGDAESELQYTVTRNLSKILHNLQMLAMAGGK
jgi:hypothetical protein